MSDDRDRGIEFGSLTDDLEAETYPLTKEELLANYGDRELEHPNGTDTLREILVEESEEEYQDADEVHESILNMIGSEAVGTEGYSDRGDAVGEEEPDSF